jgi:hypothetical protein
MKASYPVFLTAHPVTGRPFPMQPPMNFTTAAAARHEHPCVGARPTTPIAQACRVCRLRGPARSPADVLGSRRGKRLLEQARRRESRR